MSTRSKHGHLTCNMKNKLTAFFCGDITVTLLQVSTNFWQELGTFGIKMVATFMLGIAGGLAGLIAKEFIWPYLKKYIDNFKNNKNKPS